MMASLDLSAAFDTVNIELLLKRMRILGLPDDIVDLVEVWLKDRSFYIYSWWQHTTIFIAKHIRWPTLLKFL